MFSTDTFDIVNADDTEDTDSGADFEIIAEGLASTVSKTWASVDDGKPQLVVVKTSTTIKKWAKEPHDIIKECRILKRLSHPNIIPVFDSLLDQSQNTMNIWMPHIPYTLSGLLDSSHFVPQLNDPSATAFQVETHFSNFLYLARSIIMQILYAVGYLHAQSIAHRDLKPANVLLAPSGRVMLIDFGIAWDGSKDSDDESSKSSDLWPEGHDSMYFEVSTGPYRAPELLFGLRSYDAYAIDLWSLGAMFAEFFTSLVPLSSSPTSDDLPYPSSFVTSPFVADSNSSIWLSPTRHTRDSLFDASRGEIGLAWSIFKILGTPREPANAQEETKSWAWPGFKNLPDAQKVEFTKVDGVALDVQILPNLPTTGAASSGTANAAADLIRSLLRYPPELRMKAKDAQRHPFLTSAEQLSSEYWEENIGTVNVPSIEDGPQKTLGDLLLQTLGLG